MTAISPPPVDAFTFERNMAALGRVNPPAADFLRQSLVIEGAALTEGRDGAPTFSWRDAGGRLHWLGRTSMPSLSTPALLDAYQPGQGNSLLVDIGQGEELKQLVVRLAAHQAVFVVVEHADQALLSLRLHDFASEMGAGRVVLCAGEDPWARLGQFLIDNPGYLVPDRMLCRPWYEQAYVNELSGRLERLSVEVDRARSSGKARRHEGTKARRDEGPRDRGTEGQSESVGGAKEFRLALLSNVPEVGAVRLGDSLEDAAEHLGWPCRRHTLNTPRWVSPAAIESDLGEFQPDMCLVIGVPPEALPYELPLCATAVICTHGWGLTEEWLAQVPNDVAIVLRSSAQVGQLQSAGIAEQRLIHWPPAARALTASDAIISRDKTIVLCDGLDASVDAVGLNLDTHQKLWRESRKLIAAQAATYADDDATAILRMAARNLGITMTSEEVTAGLESRVRLVLGPATVRETILQRLIDAGIPIEIYGLGRFSEAAIVAHHRGPWPDPKRSSTVAASARAVVSIETGINIPDGFLDCAAAGASLFQRAALAKHDATRFAGIDVLASAITPFRSADHLTKLLAGLMGGHTAREPIADGSVVKVLGDAHTWPHRLKQLRKHLSSTIHRLPNQNTHARLAGSIGK